MKNNRLTTLHSRHCTFVQCATTYCQADGLFFSPPPDFLSIRLFCCIFLLFKQAGVCLRAMHSNSAIFVCAKARTALPVARKGEFSTEFDLNANYVPAGLQRAEKSYSRHSK